MLLANDSFNDIRLLQWNDVSLWLCGEERFPRNEKERNERRKNERVRVILKSSKCLKRKNETTNLGE
jgi:hypothetical protein